MDEIKYDQTYFDTSKTTATAAASAMKKTATSASEVKSSIPSDFSAKSTVSSAASELEETCSSSDALTSTYDSWEQLLLNIDTTNTTIGSSTITLGLGTKYYVNYDGRIMIYVTQGSESDSDGVGYPLDQYVIGVMDGEHEAISWGSMRYHGEISTSVLNNALKAYAIVVRSYGLAQTVHSSRHSTDHKIQNGSTKQCFNTRLFSDSGQYKDWANMSASATSASLETTGMVLGKNGVAVSAYFTSSKTAKILEYAKEGYDYIQIIKLVYADAFADGVTLQYYDYGTQKTIGEVPDGTKVSKLIANNLSTETTSTEYKPTEDATSETVTVNNTTSEEEVTSTATTEVEYEDEEKTTTDESTVSTNNTKSTNTTSNSSSTKSTTTSSSTKSTSSTTSNSSSTKSTTTSSSASSSTKVSTPVSILPENKYTDVIPEITSGKLESMEISSESIRYEINGITEDVYNTYITKLKAAGYVLDEEGTLWIKDNYSLLLERNDNDLILSLNTISKI